MTRRRGGAGLPPRDRGQSVAMNYTLSLVIVTMLISGLFIGMSGYLDGEREHVTRSELEVLGNRLAADIATGDRLAQTSTGDAGVRVRTTIPPRVAGSQYEVLITSSSPAAYSYYDVQIQLQAPAVGVSKNVSTRTSFQVVDSRLDGGSYVVVFDGSDIEVTDD